MISSYMMITILSCVAAGRVLDVVRIRVHAEHDVVLEASRDRRDVLLAPETLQVTDQPVLARWVHLVCERARRPDLPSTRNVVQV